VPATPVSRSSAAASIGELEEENAETAESRRPEEERRARKPERRRHEKDKECGKENECVYVRCLASGTGVLGKANGTSTSMRQFT